MIKHITLSFLCFTLTMSLYAQSECEISNVSVTPHSCANGSFYVNVNFDIDNPQGEIFGIVGNATNYGFFEYQDLPVTLGPLAGDGETNWQFIIYDLGEPNCQYTYTLGPWDCCTISDVVVDQITCTSTSAFRARINLQHSNTDSVGFEVYSVTGALLGTFLYNMLPVTVNNIPSFRIGPTSIRICDLGNPNCCTIVQFPDPDCKKDDCEIYNLNVVQGECDNGDFAVTLNFSQMLGGTNFNVTADGSTYGPFSYTALPLTLGPFEGDSTTNYVFTVVGTGPGNHCNATDVLGTVACPPGCGFDNVDIQPMECRGDEAYTVMIDFTPVNPGVLGFSVYTQGTLLGSFDYGQVPILLDSFPATGDFYDELVLCDNGDTSCCFTYEFRALLCKDCVINQIAIEPTACDSNDQFYVEVDFYHYNQSDQGFFVAGIGGGIMGPFSYDSLPIVLGPFDGDSTTFYELLVLDVVDGFCFNGGELGIIDCECGFESFTVSPLECTGNGTYGLLLDFTPIDVTHADFDVFAGDVYVGTYRYTDLPVLIPSFPNSGNGTDILTICDDDTPTCCVSYEYAAPDCFCGITDIVAGTSECDSLSNTFDLYLDFQWDGNVSEFLISLGNDSVGVIQGANLPDTLYGLSTNTGQVTLSICGIGHPECCNTTTFTNPCQGPCAVTGLTVEALPCDSITNTFGIVVDFDWIGDYEVFEVFMDGVFLDSLRGANLPDTIFNLTTFGDSVVFSVFAQNRPDCFASVALVLEECRFIPCDIRDLFVAPGTCNSDTTFSVSVDFFYEGFSEDSVEVSVDGLVLGTFDIDSLPLVITTVPWLGYDTMTLQVCQQGDPACCESITFIAPYCGCLVESVSVQTLGYCNPDGLSFPVVVGAEWRGDVSAFTVYADTLLLAVIETINLPDTVFEFPLPALGEQAQVTLCANDDSTCCMTQSFLPPDCELCEISITSIDTLLCTGTTFSIRVGYETIGVDSTLRVWANDTYLGEYQQFHPLIVGNIPKSDSSIVLRICSSARPDCCTEMEFTGQNCPDIQCMITDVAAVYTADTAAQEFTVTLDFISSGVGPAFTVSGNGNLYGVFTYDNVPLTLAPIACDDSVTWQFVIQDILNTQCFGAIDLGIVKCDTIIGLYPDPTSVRRLDIFHGSNGAYFVSPDGATEFSLWTYDGRLLGESDRLVTGERVFVSKYTSIPGLYFIQVRSDKEIYVGKVVHLE